MSYAYGIAYPVEREPLPALATIVPGSIRFRHSSFETTISYDRTDGTHVGISIAHPLRFPDVPELVIGIYRKGEGEPYSYQSYSMAEARLFRDFLNRREASASLDEEEEK